jgi:hypothetical protein
MAKAKLILGGGDNVSEYLLFRVAHYLTLSESETEIKLLTFLGVKKCEKIKNEKYFQKAILIEKEKHLQKAYFLKLLSSVQQR